MHTIREKKLVELINENMEREITCAALLDLANDSLGPRFKLSNSKQLGFYLRKIMRVEVDLVYEKKVMFLSPSTTLVRYVFKRVDLSLPDEILKQDLLTPEKNEVVQ